MAGDTHSPHGPSPDPTRRGVSVCPRRARRTERGSAASTPPPRQHPHNRPHLVAAGRAHGQRPMRRRGAIERGRRAEGDTRPVRGSWRCRTRPRSACPGMKREQSSTRAPGTSASGNGGSRTIRLGVKSAAHRTPAENDGAERQASSKRLLFIRSGRGPALRDPSHTFSGFPREADHTRPHRTAARSSAPTGGGVSFESLFPLWGRRAAGPEGARAPKA